MGFTLAITSFSLLAILGSQNGPHLFISCLFQQKVIVFSFLFFFFSCAANGTSKIEKYFLWKTESTVYFRLDDWFLCTNKYDFMFSIYHCCWFWLISITSFLFTWNLIVFHAHHMEKYLSITYFFGITFIIRFEVKQHFPPLNETAEISISVTIIFDCYIRTNLPLESLWNCA